MVSAARCNAQYSFKTTRLKTFGSHLVLLSYVEFVNTIVCCFIWHCILLVLLIQPQDPNNRSSVAQTIEDGVCASPRIVSYNSPVGKVPDGSTVFRTLLTSAKYIRPFTPLGEKAPGKDGLGLEFNKFTWATLK